MIPVTPEQHTALLAMSYSRPALRALLGEALTEAEFVELKAAYLVLRRAARWPPAREGEGEPRTVNGTAFPSRRRRGRR